MPQSSRWGLDSLESADLSFGENFFLCVAHVGTKLAPLLLLPRLEQMQSP